MLKLQTTVSLSQPPYHCWLASIYVRQLAAKHFSWHAVMLRIHRSISNNFQALVCCTLQAQGSKELLDRLEPGWCWVGAVDIERLGGSFGLISPSSVPAGSASRRRWIGALDIERPGGTFGLIAILCACRQCQSKRIQILRYGCYRRRRQDQLPFPPP